MRGQKRERKGVEMRMKRRHNQKREIKMKEEKKRQDRYKLRGEQKRLITLSERLRCGEKSRILFVRKVQGGRQRSRTYRKQLMYN